MRKKNNNIPISEVVNYLKEDSFLPVYFLCGTDSHAIDSAMHLIKDRTASQIESDFDIDIIDCEKGTNASSVVDTALAFPFGSGKKLVIVKNFNKLEDKKILKDYVQNPSESTILVIVQHAKFGSVRSEPFKSLAEKKFVFEANELRGAELARWVVKIAKIHKLSISQENAQVLIDIVGKDKGLLESQVIKFENFVGEGNEITEETIQKLSSQTREFNIFDLQDALIASNKRDSLSIGYKLIDQGIELVYILIMLNRFFTTVAHSFDLQRKNKNSADAAKELKISQFYYKKCSQARYFKNKKRLAKAVNALLHADLTIKTTSTDPKTVLAILISDLFSKE